MSKNGKDSVLRIRFVTVFIKTIIAVIIIRFINWRFVVQLLQEHISVHLRLFEAHKQVLPYFLLHSQDMSSSACEMKSKLKVDQFYYKYYFTIKSEYFNNLYTSDLLVD